MLSLTRAVPASTLRGLVGAAWLLLAATACQQIADPSAGRAGDHADRAAHQSGSLVIPRDSIRWGTVRELGASARVAIAEARDGNAPQRWFDVREASWAITAVTVASRPQPLAVECGYHGRATLLLADTAGLPLDSFALGNELPLAHRAYAQIWGKTYRNTALLPVLAPGRYQLALRYDNERSLSIYGKNDPLAFEVFPVARLRAASRYHILATGLILGCLAMLLLYQVAQLIVYRTALYRAYCLMVTGLIAYIAYDDFLLHALLAGRRVSEAWLYLTGGLGLAGFFYFAQVALRVMDFDLRTDRLLTGLVAGQLALAVVLPAAVEMGYAGVAGAAYVSAFAPELYRLALIASLLAFAAALIVFVRHNFGGVSVTFAAGNLALVLGVLVVVTRAYLLPHAGLAIVGWYLAAIAPLFNYVIEIGLVAMSLCFAVTVALLTKQREALLERDFNRRLAETEMRALRAQLNPHFLFNGLNALKLFVIDQQPELASRYLSKFARLIRAVLEHSRETLVPLARELETLGLYLELERLRFGERFAYAIEVAPEVDASDVLVPPTLLQAFAENAIWHGLLHRERPGGQLTVQVARGAGATTVITVTDDGVGRAASRATRSGANLTRASAGLRLTAERLALLERLYGYQAHLSVDDLTDERGRGIGTRVRIRIAPAEVPPVPRAGGKGAPTGLYAAAGFA